MTVKQPELDNVSPDPIHDEEGLKKNHDNQTPVDDDMSEEDQQLRDEILTCVQTLQRAEKELYMAALQILADRIRDSTCSMTSVPKPLKFLKPKFNEIVEIYDNIEEDSNCKQLCAEVVSAVAMTIGFKGLCLTYRLKSGSFEIVKWGHEYIKHLSAEMCMVGQDPTQFDHIFTMQNAALMELANVVVPYFLAHNSEADAVDLLGDFENLELIEKHCEEDNFSRVALYMTSCANYLSSDGEDMQYLRNAFRLYLKFKDYYRAMQCAIRMGSKKDVQLVYPIAEPSSMRLQLAYMLAMNGWRRSPLEDEQEMGVDMQDAFNNTNLSSNFMCLARELDILEPKYPKDVYKAHLTDTPTRHIFGTNRDGTTGADRVRKHIADALVNGFVNAGFRKDNILFSDESNEFLANLKEHGVFTAIASMGVIRMWDVDGGLLALDKYTYSSDDYVKGGALFGYGLSSVNVLNECDPVVAICSDCIAADQKLPVQLGAVMGLAVAYAGTGRKDIMAMFLKCLEENDDIELNSICVLCSGIVGIGSSDENQEVITSLMNWTMSQKEITQLDPLMKLVAAGIALFYFQQTNKSTINDLIDSTHVLVKPLAQSIKVLTLALSSAGTGDMLRIQEILAIGYALNSLSKPESDGSNPADDPDSCHANQKDHDEYNHAPTVIAISIIGIGLIAMGDDIGTDMAFRMLCQMLHSGNPGSKKAVPLAISLLAVSNPKLNFMDTLAKFAHDSDQSIAINSIMALGLIGAGTNNARILAMLRQLSLFHTKDPFTTMAVRVSQGLIHLGKGTMSLNPYRTDRSILNPIAIAGLVSTCLVCLEPKLALTRFPHHLLLLMLASHPRFLMTIDEATLKPINVSVRVGQAVDIVGQAGNPKTITGFQTHDTPVLLSYGERAELTTGEDEYISLSPVLEGIVILRKKEGQVNPVES
ncbi:hypothetical protein GJ496_009510 [Pomphorhynchus laevis]|nr:hypothetical protein GJ496_009510 [Pomphorhynchus laevis]